MTLTQAQRDEIRYAFEDAGMPEVLAFMAGQVADCPLSPTLNVWRMCVWKTTPQGYDFWNVVHENMEHLK
jgi:hypothetical protein